MEYASSVWSPHTQSSISNLERIQRRLCRLFPTLLHLSYQEQLSSLVLLSLRARRLWFQLIIVFKMYKGLISLDFHEFFEVQVSRKGRGHNCHIITKFSSYNYKLNFFSVSSISFWNQLSQDDIDATSVVAFKSRLAVFFNRLDIW